MVVLRITQGRSLGVNLALALSDVGGAQHRQALSIGRHDSVLDAVVNHLDEVAGAVWSAMVWSTTAAGTMSHTALGFASFFTRSWSEVAPTAFSFANSFTVWGDLSNTTQSCPFLISRRTMLAPILPSPTIPSCIISPLL